jgi:3-oxoacyl-(acyl-carrier-protein) synthase
MRSTKRTTNAAIWLIVGPFSQRSKGPSLVVMSLRKTYTGYSIGCAVVWGVILTFVAVMYPDRLHTYLLVAGG